MMDKEIFGVPFVMLTGFNCNKIFTKLLWLTCTILCHYKEFWHIVDYKVYPFKVSQWEGWMLCYCARNLFQNASGNRYDNKNTFKSSYVSSIDKTAFRLYFKPIIDSREREVRFIDNIISTFEDHFSIRAINIFDVLDDFDTDTNEAILINTESSSILEDFHED